MANPQRDSAGDTPEGAQDSRDIEGMHFHSGHRQRMRERFRRCGLDGFQDHELLELLLYFSRAQGDTNRIAHQLLITFGSLKGVLEAGYDQLREVCGIGDSGATLLTLMLPISRRYELSCAEQVRLDNRDDLKQYCIQLARGLQRECFFLLGLGVDHRILGHRLIASGSLTELAFNPRVVLEAVFQFNAYTIVFCHNHPTGRCEPSAADLQTTQRYAELLDQFDVPLEDHIIISDQDSYSMAEHEDLPCWKPQLFRLRRR